MASVVHGGRYDFDDGGTYCGGWEEGKAHGFGVCTGPKGLGEFSGFWQFGYEVSGVYLWPSGNCYEGQWMSGKRHGLGAERKGRWIYKGEWTQGFKGRYGVRISERSGARFEGTWANGVQDGYGVEVYGDGGTYHGQISQGLRSGYGVRRSVPWGVAARCKLKLLSDSLTSLRSVMVADDVALSPVIRHNEREADENKGGFVLHCDVATKSTTGRAAKLPHQPQSTTSGQSMPDDAGKYGSTRISLRKAILARLRKQKSTGDIDDIAVSTATKKFTSYRSSTSTNSYDSKQSNRTVPLSEYGVAHDRTSVMSVPNRQALSSDDAIGMTNALVDPNVIESYMGEWKADKRTGYGIAERSDGLRYEGEWLNNKKHGYGVSIFRDGTREEGKYKNGVLVVNRKKLSRLLALRVSKAKQRAAFSANNAISAAQTAQQRAEIAISRASNARAKSQAAEVSAKQARGDSEMARMRAKEIAPDFKQPGISQASRNPIPLDIDNQGDDTRRAMRERISNTLPYPTGFDYTMGVPGMTAATLMSHDANTSIPAVGSVNFPFMQNLQAPHPDPNLFSSIYGMYNVHGTTEHDVKTPSESHYMAAGTTPAGRHAPKGFFTSGGGMVTDDMQMTDSDKKTTDTNYTSPSKTVWRHEYNRQMNTNVNQSNTQRFDTQVDRVMRDADVLSRRKTLKRAQRVDADWSTLCAPPSTNAVSADFNTRLLKPNTHQYSQEELLGRRSDGRDVNTSLNIMPSPHHLQRRKSLPCIVTEVSSSTPAKPTPSPITASSRIKNARRFLKAAGSQIAAAATDSGFSTTSSHRYPAPNTTCCNAPAAAGSASTNLGAAIATIVIDDGVRKKITEWDPDETEVFFSYESSPKEIRHSSSEESLKLPHKIVLEKLNTVSRKSIPDHLDERYMRGLTREEIFELSSQRRDELRHIQYLNENPMLRLRLTVKDYIMRHKILIIFVMINLLVALWIYCRTSNSLP